MGKVRKGVNMSEKSNDGNKEQGGEMMQVSGAASRSRSRHFEIRERNIRTSKQRSHNER